MSTSSTIRPAQPFAQRPLAPAQATGVALDPVRLLKKYYPLLVASAVLGAIIGLAAFFVLRVLAPSYTASATFACYPQQTDIKFAGSQYIGQEELTRFMGTQAALMTSSPILERVLRDSDVENSSWAKQYYSGGKLQPKTAMVELEKDLYVRNVPQTNLIRISMSWRDPADVRKIIDTVVKVYQEDLRRQSSAESVERRQVLGAQISALDSQIKDLNAQRDRILQDNGISDVTQGFATEDVRTKDLNEKYVATVQAITATRSALERYQKELEQNSVIQYPDELREQAQRDPVVLQLEQGLASLRADYGTLKAQGFGEDHNTVVSIRKRIDATTKERDDVQEAVLRKLFLSEIDRLRAAADGLAATQVRLLEELKETDKRKQDLTRLRLRIKDIEEDVQRRTLERTDLEVARKNMEMIVSSSVFDRVRLLVPAQLPQFMSFPRWEIFIPLGIVLFAGFTAGLVVLRELLDQRVRGPSDLATLSRIRLMGMVPDAQEDPARTGVLATAFRDAPMGVIAESFRLLTSPLVKTMDQAGHKALLVLGGMPGSGATTVATNLALVIASTDERVLVIDANMRRPGVHKVFGLSEGPGLGDILAGQSTLDQAAVGTSVHNLFVLSAGSATNRGLPERLGSETMGRLIAEACGKYDRVIIDSAPAMVSADGFAIANRAHAVVLVIRALAEKRGLVNRLRAQLAESRGEFLGVIINGVRASAGGYLRANIKAAHEYQSSNQAA